MAASLVGRKVVQKVSMKVDLMAASLAD
jgi:hypothetical protein